MDHYVLVSPCIRSIRGKDQFTYRATIQLPAGSLVWIPWRSQTIVGVVVGPSQPFPKAKAVQAAFGQLPPAYWQFIRWLSEQYDIPLSTALLAALPAFVRAPKPAHITVTQPPTMRISKHRLPLIQAVVRHSNQTTTILYQSPAELHAVVQGLIATHTGPIAIICPELAMLNTFPGLPVTGKGLRLAWEVLLARRSVVLVGTKRLALLPLTEASIVIVIDPEHPAHEQWDQKPRYHVYRVVEQQAKHAIYLSQAPLIQQVAQHPVITTLLTAPATKLVSISPQVGAVLPDSVLERLAQSKHPVIWHNRKGTYRYIVCLACQQLSHDVAITQCSRCGSANLRVGGFGVTALQAWLRKQLPDRTITVGTSELFAVVDWSQVDYAVATTIDGQLANPDYRSHEQLLQQLIWLRNRVPQLDLVTAAPEHPVITAVHQAFPATWYQATIAARQRYMLGFPA